MRDKDINSYDIYYKILDMYFGFGFSNIDLHSFLKNHIYVCDSQEDLQDSFYLDEDFDFDFYNYTFDNDGMIIIDNSFDNNYVVLI